ncbi:MAG: sugar phosphate nucleotidyltransferase [Euryarchaeota archaeon]|jgi:NDP-sugar pyrophosphorylase family protein|uniref:nucleotidyltransferase family protein n=1 Tax=Methanobacterium sp. MZD130B TaxID=3394378 RepID=UPI00175388F8|nr:sugar phosphate nucleotidyltransferase [Euryarchaeota archaeon]HHT18723.1 NTP transferase domain-containing protein [Methanobacterium sp.]
MKALVLAGGKGRRLQPYTTIIPKPLMPIGDKAILEIVIEQLKYYGFDEIILSIGHLGELFMAFFGDGSKYGVKIEYVKEEKPLGTAGPLSLIKDMIEEPFLMMNGDVLTNLDFSDLVNYHKTRENIGTVALNKRVVNIDFGVTEIDDQNQVTQYTEKPVIDYLVSMGIYIFEPDVLDYVEDNQYFDLPELITKLINNQEPVNGYVFDDYWLDIGRHDDYQQANQEFDEIYQKLFPDKGF